MSTAGVVTRKETSRISPSMSGSLTWGWRHERHPEHFAALIACVFLVLVFSVMGELDARDAASMEKANEALANHSR